MPCLAFLAAAPPLARPPETLAEYARQSQRRSAYGCYFQKAKGGWVVAESKLGKHDGKDVLVATTELYFAEVQGGTKTVTKFKTVTCCALEGEGALVFSEVRYWTNQEERMVRAVCKGTGALSRWPRNGARRPGSLRGRDFAPENGAV